MLIKPCVILLAALQASISFVLAGSPASPSSADEADEPTGLEWELSTGFDTHYMFRGERFQRNTPWAQISLDVPLSESLSLNLVPWFCVAPGAEYHEFDFNGTLTYGLGSYELDLGYALYYYPRGVEGYGLGQGDEQEFSLGVSRELGTLSASVLAVYSLPRDGFYYEALLEQPYEFNDFFSLKLVALVGFDNHYFGDGMDWNHAMATLEAPVKFTESLILTPYVSYNVPWGHLDYEPNTLFGGVRLAWSF